ncbi:hypothetical protein MMC08_001339 [Hypocenomyce scalaris]|nr:hypothetical protein [Hypocenomyce scalaris]
MADDPTDVTLEDERAESSTSGYSESGSEHSSSSVPEERNSRPRPGKRRLQAPNPPTSRIKRLKVFYNDEYRKLFNDTTREIARGEDTNEHDLLPSSQIGVTVWSPQEKEIFFRTLAKLGRDDLKTIAARIGTKSEMEVNVYLQLLRQGLQEQHLYDRHHQLLGHFDLPVAFEISLDCCKALEQAAEALGVLQQKHEEKVEKQKHPGLWLLNHNVAEWADQRLHGDEEGHAEVRGSLPAAELLNLKSLLQLSILVFMNPNVPENNWRSYAERSDTPSIMYTAFSDFHTLVTSITKRLVQSSLYFAMARLRATDSNNYTHKQAVRRRDVTAALSVLGMEANAHDFWIGCARRCKLDVYLDVNQKSAESKKLSYVEVERQLNLDDGLETYYASSSGEEDGNSAGPDEDERAPTADETDYSLSNQEAEEPAYSSGWSSAAFSTQDIADSSAGRRDRGLQLERDQDAYTEAFDNQASRLEEQSLWNMLGRESVPDNKPEERELPTRPIIERKRKDDLLEWRDWMRYRSEWEKWVTAVPASSFHAKRKHGSLPGTKAEAARKKHREGPSHLDAGYDGSDESIGTKEGGLAGDTCEAIERDGSGDEAASRGDSTETTEKDADEEGNPELRSADDLEKNEDVKSVPED